ncbi:MFS transporter [Bifidobacterium favimelis]|uniref:MFS transporter n=1 Tax=Bifidobacterium favimelis TaxID=3122979 RepID=A0ABU8ZPE3_9BIFI
MRWLREFMSLPDYLRAMLIVDLMCNFGIGLVMPIELLFATHSLGATMSEAALLVTVSSVGSLISNPIIGWVSDRRSSWLAMHTAMIFSVVGPLVFTLAHDYRMGVVGAFISGLGMGMETSWSSILTQISTRDQHRIVYGINQAELNLGIGLGAAVGGLLAAGGQDSLYRLGFGGRALGFALLSLSLLVIERHYGLRRLTNRLRAQEERISVSAPSTGRKEGPAGGPSGADGTGGTRVHAGPAERGPYGGTTSSLTRILATMAILICGTFFMDLFGYSQFDAGLVTTLISDPHIPRWSLSVVDVVNTFSVVIMNIILLPRLKDANHVRILRTVPVFWAAAWIIIVLGLRLDTTAGALGVASLGIMIFGLGEVMMGISQPVVATELAGPAYSGRMFGMLNTAASLGYIVGPMFASYILDGHETIPFLSMCAIGLMVLSLPWFLLIPSHRR